MLQEIAASIPAIDARVVLLVLIGGAVLMLAIGIAGLVGNRDPIEERVSAGARRPGVDGAAKVAIRRGGGSDILKRFAPFLTPSDLRTRSSMRERLTRAGYRSDAAMRIYFFSRAMLGLGVAMLTATLLPLLASNADPIEVLLFTLGAALVGYMAPGYWVMRRIQSREEQIRCGFPDTLDMLLVCVEAGQALDMALARVSQEMAAAHPVLADELALVSYELRAGKGRSEVLRDFARRTGVEDVSAFVTVLIQSDQFGTSIGDALRVYASEMRQKRLVRAEEKANKLPVKLALGTMAFTVPPVLLILIGPSIIMVMRSFARFMS